MHHRHVSHLYGLHPGNLITPDHTPGLAEACRVTLNRRGDGGTGWSRAWKINFWARLGDGNRAWKLFKSLLHPAVDEKQVAMVVELFPIFSVRTHLSRLTGIMEVLLVSEKCCCRAMRGLSIYYPLCLIVGIRVVSGGCVYVAVLLLIWIGRMDEL